MRRCYIVVRQLTFVSDGVRKTAVEDNPVRCVFTTSSSAEEFALYCIRTYLAHEKAFLHLEEDRPSSEVIYRAKAVDANGKLVRSYSVIKEGMMV